MTSRIERALAPMIAAWLLAIASGPGAARQGDLVYGASIAIAPSVFVTNDDLVADCTAINIAIGDRSASAHVIVSDEIDNLALVGADIATGGFAALRRDPDIGEAVTMLSFVTHERAERPGRLLAEDGLSGSAGVDAQLISGTIAAMTGPGDDGRFLQISARLRADDGGSPVLDAFGNLVGVIDGETDALVVDELTAFDIQDIAFAMRVNAIGRLADEVHIPFAAGSGTGWELTPDMLTKRITGFTARLSCER